jgi:hypothetical protein
MKIHDHKHRPTFYTAAPSTRRPEAGLDPWIPQNTPLHIMTQRFNESGNDNLLTGTSQIIPISTEFLKLTFHQSWEIHSIYS